MAEHQSSNLVADLREAAASARGNGGHRELCGLAANEIERLKAALAYAINTDGGIKPDDYEYIRDIAVARRW